MEGIDFLNPFFTKQLCAFGAAVTSFGLIRYYNLLATRPLPSFYDRTGGNDDAKK